MSIDQVQILLDNSPSNNGVLAQLVEHRTFNPMVGSSILPHPTILKIESVALVLQIFRKYV